MPTPIFKGFLGRPTAAWYALDEAGQAGLLDKVNAALADAGGRRIVMADASWSSERYLFFGVEEFPDVAALQAFHAQLMALDWPRYMQSSSAVGHAWARAEAGGSVCKFFIGRMTAAWYALSAEDRNREWQRVTTALADVGGTTVVACDSYWASEQHEYFGVDVYSDLDAVQRFGAALAEMGWMRFVDSTIVLGTRQ